MNTKAMPIEGRVTAMTLLLSAAVRPVDVDVLIECLAIDDSHPNLRGGHRSCQVLVTDADNISVVNKRGQRRPATCSLGRLAGALHQDVGITSDGEGHVMTIG